MLRGAVLVIKVYLSFYVVYPWYGVPSGIGFVKRGYGVELRRVRGRYPGQDMTTTVYCGGLHHVARIFVGFYGALNVVGQYGVLGL